MGKKKSLAGVRYNLDEIDRYYLYRHIRLDKNEPFYIGIADKQANLNPYGRAYDISNRNKIWKDIFTKNNKNIRVEILFECQDYDEIEQKEIEFIKLYGRIDLGTGILANLCDGGKVNWGYFHKEETKEYFSKLYTGKKLSLERKLNLCKQYDFPIIQFDLFNNIIKRWETAVEASLNLDICLSYINNVLKGKWVSTHKFVFVKESEYNSEKDYTYVKPLSKRPESNPATRKPVIQLDLNGDFIKEWGSGREAALALSINPGEICNSCKGKAGTAGNYMWVYKSKYDSNIDYTIGRLSSRQKRVVQLDLQNNFIKEWINIEEASTTLNIPKRKIYRCIDPRERTHQAGGYKWMYLEDYQKLTN